MKNKSLNSAIFILVSYLCFSQDVSLYSQFNGRYNYTAIGNTLNPIENSFFAGNCSMLSSSSANLNLLPSQNVIAAYLYWAGSGQGDFEIELNGTPLTADRTFLTTFTGGRFFFSAFKDVTSIVQAQGNGNYTFSGLDISSYLTNALYCNSGTTFGGWAITIIYQDDSLPLNQLNVYDGMQRVPDQLTIVLENLNVLDNVGAKIGFVAWEGDSALAVNEQLTINGNVIGNPPLNPTNNAFNGTNSFTGANDLFNMDIDVYSIQNNINVGDSTATITLTSGQDFVMINNVITVLNSQLPDATVNIIDQFTDCSNEIMQIEFEILNLNSTAELTSNTEISIYIGGNLVANSQTQNEIPIGGSETQSLTINIPDNLTDASELVIIVDENQLVTEINDNNNEAYKLIESVQIIDFVNLEPITSCKLNGVLVNAFDLTAHVESLIGQETVSNFYTSISDLENNTSSITMPNDYVPLNNNETIYFSITNVPCTQVYQFDLQIIQCKPTIPSGFSPNQDPYNNFFNISGLYNIFENHQLKIFNRLGTLIFIGDNDTKWDGRVNQGLGNHGELVPVGIYYYLLDLKTEGFEPLLGWVYVNY